MHCSDISWTVTTLSQYLSKALESHCIALKHLCRYLQGTIDYELCCRKSKSNEGRMLIGYSDVDQHHLWMTDIVLLVTVSVCLKHVHPFHGNLESNLQLHCHHEKRSTLHWQLLYKKTCFLHSSWIILIRNQNLNLTWSLKTIKEPLHYLRMLKTYWYSTALHTHAIKQWCNSG